MYIHAQKGSFFGSAPSEFKFYFIKIPMEITFFFVILHKSGFFAIQVCVRHSKLLKNSCRSCLMINFIYFFPFLHAVRQWKWQQNDNCSLFTLPGQSQKKKYKKNCSCWISIKKKKYKSGFSLSRVCIQYFFSKRLIRKTVNVCALDRK